MNTHNQYDAIVVGSGPGGATVARELSRHGARVLILERGGNPPLKDGLLATLPLFNAVPVGDKLIMGRALTTGGTTSVYLGATVRPPIELFQSQGIDLTSALEEAEKELPLAPLPDELLRPHSVKLRESAAALGHKLYRSRMLIDQSKCRKPGYNFDAKWTARDYVREAIENGATLVNRARVLRVLTENDRAIGVEYELPKSKKEVEVHQAFASKIVLAAGGAATPIILRRSGVQNVANEGFYCHPSVLIFGTISGLKGTDGFGGSWGLLLDGGIHVGDANFNRTLYRMIMLGQKKFVRAFTPSRTIAMGVMVKESLGGELQAGDRFHKHLTKEDLDKLTQGESVARQVLEHAGARDLFKTGISASHVGGTIRVKEHLDEKLETEFRNLHVCDGSMLPGTVNTPTLTLICLGKYLANHLAN